MLLYSCVTYAGCKFSDEDAYNTLQSSKFVLEGPDAGDSFKCLMASKKNNELFYKLATEGTKYGRLYGAIGLYNLKSIHIDEVLGKLKNDNTSLTYYSDHIYETTVKDVAIDIENGEYEIFQKDAK